MPYKDKSVRKSKHKEYSRKHYEENKVERLAKLAIRKKELRAEWDTFKCSLKCTQCGFSHIAALDFHHTNPTEKEGVVSNLISNGQFRRAREEAAKCIVLCANCHRIHHFNERKASYDTGN